MKYGLLGGVGALALGSELESNYEASEVVTKRFSSDRDFALQQIDELESSYKEAANGNGGVVDSFQLLYQFLGNPNHYEMHSRSGFIPDRDDLLDEKSPREAFRTYVQEGVEEVPVSSTQASVLLDQRLDLDLVYLDQGEDAGSLVSNGFDTMESEIGGVLPGDYDLSVNLRRVEPGAEIEEVLEDLGGEQKQSVLDLNEVLGYDTGSTLPVYVFDPREFDRLSGLAQLDFDRMWAGYGAPEGSLVALPSTLLRISENQFYSNLVHEVGHSAFELPHSAAPDDVMTYNEKAGEPTGFTVSQPLLQSYLDSDFEFREEERDGVRGVYFRQEPGEIPRSKAVNAFFANLNGYITDMVDEFDLDVNKFEEMGYERRDGFDVAQYRDYDGTGVGMDISVNQQIHDIEKRLPES